MQQCSKHVQGVHSSLGLLEEFLTRRRDLKELEVDVLHHVLQPLGALHELLQLLLLHLFKG